ncbi:MAG: peptidylprolyl isomerase [Cohaesibacteraceae bacterium]|nr:peptidylprolyl isomerase [Cohaesibacteraceae bacterium]
MITSLIVQCGIYRLWIKTTKLLFLSMLIGVSTSLVWPDFSHARSVTIKALVNDVPITDFDISQRKKLIALVERGRRASNTQVLNQLIDEVLWLSEAKRRNFNIAESRIDQTYSQISKSVTGSAKGLTRVLRSRGINPNSFKKQLRARQTQDKIVRARFNATVNVSDQDVSAFLLDSDKTSKQEEVEYRNLQQIVFVVPKNSSKTYERQIRTRAKRLRNQFHSCSTGLATIRGLKDVVVDRVGRKLASALPPKLRKSLEKVAVGKLSAPVRIPDGFEMIAVCDKKKILSSEGARSEARQKIRNTKGQALIQRYIRDLRADATIIIR